MYFSKYNPIVVSAILALFAGSTVSSWSANLAYSYGFGARGIALAGSGSATVDDLSSVYFNPAGLTSPKSKIKFTEKLDHDFDKRHDSLSWNMSFAIPAMSIENKNGSAVANKNAQIASDLSTHGIQQFSASLDLRRLTKFPYNIPIRVGFAALLFGDGKDLIQANIGSQKAYSFTNLGYNTSKPEILSALSFQPWQHRLSIALGTSMSSSIKGKLQLTELDQKPVLESQTVAIIKPSLTYGIVYRQPLVPKQELFISTSFKGKSDVDADLSVDATIPLSGLEVVSTTQMQLFTYFTPDIFTMATSYHFREYQFHLDVDWQRWSQFRLGKSFAVYEESPKFNDILVWRIGFQGPLGFGMKKLWDLQLRAGYAITPSYTPDQTGASNYLDNEKHNFSVGLKKSFAKWFIIKVPFFIEWGFQWQTWLTRTSEKSNAVKLPDGTFQPNYSYGGDLFLSSLAITFEF